MNSIGLLIRIIGTEGVIGECAYFYLFEEKKRETFLKGCSNRFCDKNIQNALGEHLMTDIQKYLTTKSSINGRRNL